MIDNHGFRANVCIVLTDGKQRLFWAKRIGQDAWQFPQGGVAEDETTESAMYRELHEEIGLEKDDVSIITTSKTWLRYRLPQKLIRRDSQPLCIGQKQWWYLLKLETSVDNIKFDTSGTPEFDGWQWVNYWYPVSQVVSFKREVYRRALKIFASYIFDSSEPRVGLSPIFGDVSREADDLSKGE